MKKSQPKKNTPPDPEVLCGVYSKREAVVRISNGCRHIHSTVLGDRDPSAKLTLDSTSSTPRYAWEPVHEIPVLILNKSTDRAAVIEKIVSQQSLEKKRALREKIASVLEELLTNALYHAYRTPAGEEKYARRSEVTLKGEETLSVHFQISASGVFLSVTDRGGSLTFDAVARSLWRCYESSTQIENKEGGAGLGTYMVFDAVTHLKIVAVPGEGTTVSCWISDQRSYDPEVFSFNFFERRQTK